MENPQGQGKRLGCLPIGLGAVGAVLIGVVIGTYGADRAPQLDPAVTARQKAEGRRSSSVSVRYAGSSRTPHQPCSRMGRGERSAASSSPAAWLTPRTVSGRGPALAPGSSWSSRTW